MIYWAADIDHIDRISKSRNIDTLVYVYQDFQDCLEMTKSNPFKDGWDTLFCSLLRIEDIDTIKRIGAAPEGVSYAYIGSLIKVSHFIVREE